MNLPIPTVDPLPLPAPVWLLQFLLVFTFILHVIPMNLVLGGSIAAAFSLWRGQETLARKLLKMLPVATALTITLGIAPLLFLQVLYGQFFYSSAILLAVPWLLVVPLLIAAYYGFYYNALTTGPLTGRNVAVAFLSTAIVLTIGFIYSNNMTLMLAPERWRQFTDSASTFGTALNVTEHTLVPRYLHMVFGALAVTGMFIALRGHTKIGVLQFAIATLLNIGIGLWFLFSLPENIRALFLGGSVVHTTHLWGAVGVALVALMLALLAVNSAKPRPLLISASASLFLTIVLMAAVRHFVRNAYLKPHLDLAMLPVKPMWDVFALFAVLLVAGLAVVAWMVTKVVNAKPTAA